MATLTNRLRLTLVCVLSFLAMMLVCTALALPAQAKTLTFNSGVSDDITRVEVSKMNPKDHSYVVGATLAIVDKNGTIVHQWTTVDGKAEMVAMELNVNEEYILREISAPKGYEKAPDVHFIVLPSEEDGIKILSPEPGPSTYEQTGSYSINLYDTKLPIEVEQTQVVNRGVAPKTGDDTPFGVVAAIGAAALIGIVVLQFMKPRKKDEE